MSVVDERCCAFCAAWRRAASRSEALALCVAIAFVLSLSFTGTGTVAVFLLSFSLTEVAVVVVNVTTSLFAGSGLSSTSASFSIAVLRTSSKLFCAFGLLRCGVLLVRAVFFAIITYSPPGRSLGFSGLFLLCYSLYLFVKFPTPL